MELNREYFDEALKGAVKNLVTSEELDRKLKPIKDDIGVLKTDVSSLKTDVGSLKTDVSSLKTDVGSLKTDVSALKDDVGVLKKDMVSVKNQLNDIKFKVDQTAILAVNFSEDHKDVPKKIDDIRYIQNIHTNSLDTLMTKYAKESDTDTIVVSRLERDEKIIKDLAMKADLKLDW